MSSSLRAPSRLESWRDSRSRLIRCSGRIRFTCRRAPDGRCVAVVGKPSTPTPTGDFFVEETVILPATKPGGPYALALSARSNVLQDFDCGPGQIGIHGRDLLGGTMGQAQSHGCLRLSGSAITWLAHRIGPGVPVTIIR